MKSCHRFQIVGKVSAWSTCSCVMLVRCLQKGVRTGNRTGRTNAQNSSVISQHDDFCATFAGVAPLVFRAAAGTSTVVVGVASLVVSSSPPPPIKELPPPPLAGVISSSSLYFSNACSSRCRRPPGAVLLHPCRSSSTSSSFKYLVFRRITVGNSITSFTKSGIWYFGSAHSAPSRLGFGMQFASKSTITISFRCSLSLRCSRDCVELVFERTALFLRELRWLLVVLLEVLFFAPVEEVPP
mmetsp:Transcript_4368/g.10688  ORF Transcript_4368/g.10688 Transcript_4368/m.10688 type:complete len:241 (-) Transcript_4368:1440-2162(-)